MSRSGAGLPTWQRRSATRQLVVIDGAGHSPNVTHREQFDAAIAKFLAGLEL